MKAREHSNCDRPLCLLLRWEFDGVLEHQAEDMHVVMLSNQAVFLRS